MAAPANDGVRRTRGARDLTPAQREKLDRWAAERDLWLRQDGEPEHAYQGFLAMRDAPPPRPSTRELCAQLGSRTKPQTWRVWASRWLWDARIEAWDRHVQAPVAAAIVARHALRAEDVADRQIEHARKMHELATLEMDKLLQISRKSPEPIVGVKTLLQLITLALELEKQLVPIDATGSTPAGPPNERRPDFSVLEMIDLKRLREIAVKCGATGGD